MAASALPRLRRDRRAVAHDGFDVQHRRSAAGAPPDWTVPAVTVVYSVTRPLTAGSFLSALAEIAGADLLDQASAVEATNLNLAVVVGPALAGALAGAIGPARTVELQAALTILVAALVAVNPAFEARGDERATSVAHALRTGLRALAREPVLITTSATSGLAAFSWGLMLVGFPLYAVRTLHGPSHASGYLWAAVAAGSVLGTFALGGRPRLRRVAGSYGALALSSLLWPLAAATVGGVALTGLTGVLEGPAYAGTIALRQRHAPVALRAQVMTTLNGVSQVAMAAGAVVGGWVQDPLTLILAFCAVNLAASAGALAGERVLTRAAGGS